MFSSRSVSTPDALFGHEIQIMPFRVDGLAELWESVGELSAPTAEQVQEIQVFAELARGLEAAGFLEFGPIAVGSSREPSLRSGFDAKFFVQRSAGVAGGFHPAHLPDFPPLYSDLCLFF